MTEQEKKLERVKNNLLDAKVLYQHAVKAMDDCLAVGLDQADEKALDTLLELSGVIKDNPGVHMIPLFPIIFRTSAKKSVKAIKA